MIYMAFRSEGVTIKIDKILPVKKIKPSIKNTKKYRQIYTSTREVGIIEHLVIYPHNNKPGSYILLDGHLRLEVLKDLNQEEAPCLISTDDEGVTYNHKINKIISIQEHFMILKAIKRGVSEERIAKALDVNIGKIKEKRDLLNGISQETVKLLKDRRICPRAISEIRKMKPLRQMEVAELMIAANNFTIPYAKALLAATRENQLIMPKKTHKMAGLSSDDLARMEQEAEKLERDFITIKDSYGENALNLVLATGHVSKLLDNARMVRFLSNHYSGILSEFQKIVEATSLGKQ